jgi:hypothetical protein
MYTESLSQSLRIQRKHFQIPGKGGEDSLSLVFMENFGELPETSQVFSVYERKDPALPKM